MSNNWSFGFLGRTARACPAPAWRRGNEFARNCYLGGCTVAKKKAAKKKVAKKAAKKTAKKGAKKAAKKAPKRKPASKKAAAV
jgi:hypothetical protein